MSILERARTRKEDAIVGRVRSHVRNPSAQHRTRSGTGFTIWRAHGFVDDGWHPGNPPIEKEFDTSYPTADEANARARFVFYRENPWGLSVAEIQDSGPAWVPGPGVSEKKKRGLSTLHCAPEASGEWTVGVVPDAAFEHLDNAAGDGVHNRGRDSHSDGCY